MTPWALSLLVLVVTVVFFCYWGAGVILHPPAMSRLTVFPEQFGLPHERIQFKTSDGLTLKGWWIAAPEPAERRTLLLCHGWGDNKGELLRETAFLHEAGFNLLYFDSRSHGDSEGEITTIGYLETLDFEAAIRFLAQAKPDHARRLGVFGFSMGAAVACMAVPKHPEVKAVVLESPFTDYRRVVRQYAWNHFHLPYFPLVKLSLLFLRARVGTSKVDSYSPRRFVSELSPRPVLMIAGSEDILMPEWDVRALFALAKEPKSLWVIHGASHGKCRQVAGLEYEARVAGFFRRHLAAAA
ncbi:MAG: alpha/beta fold hydrolase [Elusimicrobia bacterium]|nr:alpha/beta fold hydrolase [Elusimicrobiota bacterium]MDE2237026.1 alpha/beta fold hydrolase [Elusimicrobiota bacterium]MDE2425813.1 alpha/beta fold hydrolase [Elusimicrobiota bacterium]